MKTEKPPLVLYPGLSVTISVPRDQDTKQIDAAIRKIRADIKTSIRKHIPRGCRAEIGEEI